MSRSVSVPSNAMLVNYAVLDSEVEEWDFRWMIENFQNELQEDMPSLTPANFMLGREDRVVADNRLVCFTVSEYCGLVSLAIVPQEGKEALARSWVKKIAARFNRACASSWGPLLNKVGTFSNGEALFRLASGEPSGPLGLGYSSKEGFL